MTCYKCGEPTMGDNLQCDDCRLHHDDIDLIDDDLIEDTTNCPHCGWPNEVWRNRCVDCKRDMNS